jgi:hypothetical protein
MSIFLKSCQEDVIIIKIVKKLDTFLLKLELAFIQEN